MRQRKVVGHMRNTRGLMSRAIRHDIYLGTCEDNLARDEDKEHDLRLDHAVDKPREQLRLVAAELSVAIREALETNRELHVAAAHDILDLELREPGLETKFLDDARVFARREAGVVLGLRTRDDHLARRKDEGSRLGITNTHDDGGETLGIILCVPGVKRDRLEIESTVQVHRRDDVLEGRHNAFHSSDVLLFEGEGSGSGGNDCRPGRGRTRERLRGTHEGRGLRLRQLSRLNLSRLRLGRVGGSGGCRPWQREPCRGSRKVRRRVWQRETIGGRLRRLRLGLVLLSGLRQWLGLILSLQRLLGLQRGVRRAAEGDLAGRECERHDS
jgi:hypothetical protein